MRADVDEWGEGPLRPRLGADVDVWRASIDPPPDRIAELLETLGVDERRRATCFHRARDRNRFVAAHGALRAILARYLDAAPASLRFASSRHGKPFLCDARDLRFNLSHSGDTALVAVAHGREVGVDVEQHRVDLDALTLARRFFTAREAEAISSVPADARHAVFFAYWTRKEAYTKACGRGLTMSLDGFDVSSSRIVAMPGSDAEHVGGSWTLRPLDMGPGYGGAVVVEGPEMQLRRWRLQATGLTTAPIRAARTAEEEHSR